jgi:hypothetical protein
MLIQWCLKGIPEQPGFGPAEAQDALDQDGLRADWQRAGGFRSAVPRDSHAVLDSAALRQHINAPAAVRGTTPYLSLTAGCVERDPGTGAVVSYGAMDTARAFATRNGTCPGFVFRLWVLVAPKPAPELPGFAEEVRSLLLFDDLGLFHEEGEITAKLFVPARQILSFVRFDAQGMEHPPVMNQGFVAPERISNLRELR